MPFIADAVFDAGLLILTNNGTQINITKTAEATTYELATGPDANSLGSATVTTGAAQNAATGTGRQVIVGAISNGSVSHTGTAGFWALTNGTTTLYATGALTGGGQAVTATNTFTLDAISITIRDAA